jgi:hypothetical protein
MQPLRLPYTTRWCHRARGLALATAGVIVAVGLALPATASAEAPVLGLIKASGEYSGQETIEAQIAPESFATVWTVTLDCPYQRRCQSTEGQLPADEESHTVTVVVTGLETDTRYQYTVEASNLSGATSFLGEFESIPPGAAPRGAKDEEVYVPPELPWTQQSLNEAAARAVREQREKEHAEQSAEEALTHRNEEAAQRAAAQTKMPACVVPALKGDTLAVARRSLTVAHCRLGVVHRPPRSHGALHVSRQSARPEKRLANDARVALWIERPGVRGPISPGGREPLATGRPGVTRSLRILC